MNFCTDEIFLCWFDLKRYQSHETVVEDEAEIEAIHKEVTSMSTTVAPKIVNWEKWKITLVSKYTWILSTAGIKLANI